MAAANPTFADLFREASVWTNYDPDYEVLMTTVGHAAATNSNDTAVHIHNTATRTPCVVAFTIAGDEDVVYLGHSPYIYPQDVTSPTAMDGRVVVLVGNRADACVPVVLPADAFGRLAATRVQDVATIVGPQGHGAAPPVYRAGPHAAGPNVNELRVRRALLLPPSFAATMVSYRDDGRLTLAAFYAQFVLNKHDSAVAAEQQMWSHAAQWFRAASANTAANESIVRVACIEPAAPPARMALTNFANRRIKELLGQVGYAGPNLSNATFLAGVNQLQTAMSDNQTAYLDYDRSARRKTFAEKHGAALETRLLRFTGQPDEAHLPEIHRLMTNAPRGREYSILNSQFAERATASSLHITASNAPLATPALLDQVFRNIEPMNNGLTLGRGLTPFAIVCDGHANAEKIKRDVKKNEIVSGGTTVSLTDADALTTNDISLPTEPYIAYEKLMGWSIVVDVFHGHATDIATSVRNAVAALAPYIHPLVHQVSALHSVGMENLCRVMYEVQQDYYAWLHKVALDVAGVAVPTFEDIISQVATGRVTRLSTLPHGWYTAYEGRPEANAGRGSGGNERGGGLRERTGATPRVNPRPDTALMTRFREGGHSSIKSMIGDHVVEIPKINGEEACLAWAYKGECSDNCKRKKQHVAYGRPIIQKLHGIMDICGVANPQP